MRARRGSWSAAPNRSKAVRAAPPSACSRIPATDTASVGCDGTVVDGSPEAFGLAYPVDAPLEVVRVGVDAPGGTTRDVSTLSARGAVPGLALVAPTDGATFLPGIYRLTIRDGAGSRVITACVGGATTPDDRPGAVA